MTGSPQSSRQVATSPIKSPTKLSKFNSPTRLRSPRGTPRGSATDSYLFAFLRHTRGIVMVLAVLAFFSLRRRPTIDTTRTNNAAAASYSIFPSVISNAPADEDSRDSWDNPELRPSSSSASTTQSITLNENLRVLLSSYNASLHPVFAKPGPVQVHLIADVSQVIAPPSKFLLDGIDRSGYTRPLALTFLNPGIKTVEMKARKPDLPMVWMADWGSMHRDCHRLKRALDHLGRKPSEVVLLMDFTASTRQTQCDFFDSNVRLAKRSIVKDRYFDADKESVQTGTIVENQHGAVHAPLVLREKFIEVLQEVSSNNILGTDRPIDVAFYWKNGDFSHYGFQRRVMSRVVKTLHHGMLNNHTVEAFVGTAANDLEGMVEGNVQLEYIQKLSSTKIVVIAQRDEWEDHYRLMESLASGALVMTDPMLALPSGLEDKKNIIFYDSPASLKRWIRYYLKHEDERKAIAKNGFELAAGRHRSWHRIEEVLFGRPLSHVDLPYQQFAKKPRPKTKLVEEDATYAR